MMAQPRQRRPRLLAALLVLLLSLCCLARLAGAASAASAASGTDRKGGAATATEKAAGQEAAPGFTATIGKEEAVPVRVEMEVDVEDYPGSTANDRHDPGYPRRPKHP